jgi:hypothetical protein
MNQKANVLMLIALSLCMLSVDLTWADQNDLVWNTFLGGSGSDIGYGIALDNSGNAYLTGVTRSDNFPATSGAFADTLNGPVDAFVAKFNATGDILVYATFLGGDDTDYGNSIALDNSANACLTGHTNSGDFPTTPGAFDETHNGGPDVFVAKLNATGDTLIYATYLGENNWDEGHGLIVDDSGNAYVTGKTWSSDFPTTGGAFDTTHNGGLSDVFTAKFNATGDTLSYATLLGGDNWDEGHGIAVDVSGNAYVTGYTNSSNFPTTPGAFDETHNGDFDVLVAKLNPSGSALDYATYLGDNNSDYGYSIALNAACQAHVTGETWSSDFPTTAGAFDPDYSNGEAFVAKMSATGGALGYATFLGGDGGDYGYSIAVDGSGNAHITGTTQSFNFPTTAGAYDTTYNGNEDVFVVKLNPSGSVLDYSTFLGDNALDIGYDIAVKDTGTVYVTGETRSSSFPTTVGAFDTSYNGGTAQGGDAFVFRLDLAERAYTQVFGRVGAGPEYPDSVSFIAYLAREDGDYEILTEDNWNSHLGRDWGYGGDSLCFRVHTGSFVHPAVVDGDTLVILFTGLGAEQGNSGVLRDVVDTDVVQQDWGHSPWGVSSNPAVPAGLEALNVAPGVVDLCWHACGAGDGVLSYRVYRSSQPSGAGNGASDGRYIRVARGLVDTTYRDGGAPQSLCWYLVVAVDSLAPGSLRFSGHSDEVGTDAALPVQLVSFTATGGEGVVVLRWRTESEWDNRGFHLYRGQELGGDWERVTPELIAGAGNSSEPRNYVWRDGRVEPGGTYWYELESVDLLGGTRRWGPVSATPTEALSSTAAVPQACLLWPNFPNPFNAHTWIRYQLAEGGPVSVKIYNIKGQLIRTLVDGPQPPGYYQVRWDGQDRQRTPAASGIYFCQLKSNQFTGITKMILIR